MNTRRTRSVLAVPVLILALAGLSACGSDDRASDDTADLRGPTSETTSERSHRHGRARSS